MSEHIAVINRGAQGIGEAIALHLGQNGPNIVTIDIHGKQDQMKAIATGNRII
jgi:NAD(P)-dependent dehydrogenase (short-subunit alcohol dehydrogenase family)